MSAADKARQKLGGGVDSAGTGYAPGTVYLGSQAYPASTTMSPTGVTYNIKAGKSDRTVPLNDAKKLYVTDPAVKAKWNAALKKYGFDTDPIKGRMLWEMSVDGAADWYQTSEGQQKITPEMYLQWYAKETAPKKKENLPSRQVYMYDKATVQGLISDTISKTLGRKPTDSESKDFYTAIQKMIEEGTVTTNKTRINPKTGLKESYSVTTPGYTQEKAEAFIQSKITGTEDYEEKKSLDFIDFIRGIR